jgi:hypothetical protein
VDFLRKPVPVAAGKLYRLVGCSWPPPLERGGTTHVVAQALGHESETTSRESYVARDDHRR